MKSYYRNSPWPEIVWIEDGRVKAYWSKISPIQYCDYHIPEWQMKLFLGQNKTAACYHEISADEAEQIMENENEKI